MQAAELIQKIRFDGGSVRLNENGILVAKTSPEMMAELRADKPAVINYLMGERNALVVYLDFETWSEADIKKCGAHVYAMHPSTRIHCATLCVKGGKRRLWLPGDPIPWEIWSAATIVAHNAIFEFLIIEHVASRLYGWPKVPLKRFRCTMAKARIAGYPGQLEKVCEAMGI
jgi:hypothetical protein